MPATLLDHNIQPYADLEAMLATSHKAMVVAATGAGKTSVTVKYLEDHNLRGLVVCPKVSICKQWDTVSDNIITMTYQKFCNGPDVSTYDCYIFDEAHHAGASKWGKAVKGLMASTDKPVIGLTADPKRYLDGGRDMGGQHFFEMLNSTKQMVVGGRCPISSPFSPKQNMASTEQDRSRPTLLSLFLGSRILLPF